MDNTEKTQMSARVLNLLKKQVTLGNHNAAVLMHLAKSTGVPQGIARLVVTSAKGGK